MRVSLFFLCLFVLMCLFHALIGLLHCKFYRAMIRTEYLCVDLGIFQARFEIVAHYEIVNTPTYVLLTGLEPV